MCEHVIVPPKIHTHLRFAGSLIRLNQDLTDADVFAHIAHRLFHRFSGTQNGHTAYPIAGHPFAVVRLHLRRVDGRILERQQPQGKLNHQSDQTLRVEYELVARRLLVADERVQTLDLRRIRQQIQRIGHRLADVRVRETLAQLEAAQLQLGVHVLHDQLDGDLVFAAARHDDVGVRHCGRYVVAVRWLDHVRVLLEDALHVATALRDVAVGVELLYQL